jgi:hypothetical protein
VKTDFKPELQLDRGQQAALAQTCAGEGWKIVHLIARSEVDKFVLDLVNTDSGTEAVLEKHRMSKVAAMLYEGIIRRINFEVQQYTSDNTSKEPVDLTEGLLDIGPLASRQSDFESLEGDDIE